MIPYTKEYLEKELKHTATTEEEAVAVFHEVSHGTITVHSDGNSVRIVVAKNGGMEIRYRVLTTEVPHTILYAAFLMKMTPY